MKNQSKNFKEFQSQLTYFYNLPKYVFRTMSRTIPPSVFKLILALADREFCPESNVWNQLWVLPKQSLLLRCNRFDTVGRRKLEIVIVLGFRGATNAKIPTEREIQMFQHKG